MGAGQPIAAMKRSSWSFFCVLAISPCLIMFWYLILTQTTLYYNEDKCGAWKIEEETSSVSVRQEREHSWREVEVVSKTWNENITGTPCVRPAMPDPGMVLAGYDNALTPNCTGYLCHLNQNRHAPQYYPANYSPCLNNISECVTVIVKTRFRYDYILTFIKSLREFFPEVRVIVVDEIGSDRKMPKELKDLYSQSSRVVYVKTKPGMGYGRNFGLKMVETKYFLMCDDDFIFNPSTNLKKLVSVLESSDLSIVGGVTDDGYPYDGTFRVFQCPNSGQIHLIIYSNVFYTSIPCFSHCYVGDIIKMFFLAKTKNVLKAGGWDDNRNFFEHEDFFLQMRSAGLKVGLCRDVVIKHWMRSRDLLSYRMNQFSIWNSLLLEKWQMKNYYFCDKWAYLTAYDCPNKRQFS